MTETNWVKIMNKANIPNDKRDAELYLKASKDALNDVLDTFLASDVAIVSFVIGTIYNDIEDIDKILLGDF